MKAFVPFYIFVVFSLAVSCRNGGDGSVEIITGENTEADLGVIKEKDGPVRAELFVPNDYGDTLRPVMTYVRCSCISAYVGKDPVAPGETLRVSVTYNPYYRSGIFMEEIGVKCLGKKSYVSLVVKGEVIPMKHPVEEDHPYDFGNGLHLSHEVLDFGRLESGESARIFIRCANSRWNPVALTFSPDEKYGNAVHLVNPHHLEKDGRDTVWFRFTMPEEIFPGDTLEFDVWPALNGRKAGKPLTVRAISE